MDVATKKLFSLIDSLDQRLERLDAIEQRLNDLDTNGQLDSIQKQMELVAANSQVVVSTVQSHGDTIQRLEQTLTRLNLRCPLMKPDTSEFKEAGTSKG